MNEYEVLAETLFAGPVDTLDEIEKKYPGRVLGEGASVTRFAPSPTGFMHIGGLLSALISERLAHQSDGVFYVRIEDTDKKREVAGAISIITESFRTYGITVDEGETGTGEVGVYGPYKQSERLDLYRGAVRHLVGQGRAYPCFCTSDELSTITSKQENEKIRPGYRGKWAPCRTRSVEDALALLNAGKPYVIRLRSVGNFDHKVPVKDLIKGQLSLSENDLDVVLLKSDGYPTYHLAHIVDDHLMGTTDVLRGDEWLSSTPLHVELWNAFTWPIPRYGHIAPIQKIDDGSRRKLSKRKDPEANVDYYAEKGYPPQAVIEYLMNLANSNFEDWRKANAGEEYRHFPFTLKKLNTSGALFDEVKLASISREIIAQMDVDEQYRHMTAWLMRHDPTFHAVFTQNPTYTRAVLSIEKDTAKRKDITCWSATKQETEYFFDEYFSANAEMVDSVHLQVAAEDVPKALDLFVGTYHEADDRDQWFEKIKHIANTLGYAQGVKEYKHDPTAYKGHVGMLSQVLRIAVTGRTKTPDLHDIMQVLGTQTVVRRIDMLRALL